METPDKRKRQTLVLRTDLADRVQEKATRLQQNPNQFVNYCVEGILGAMDAKDEYEIPILALYNSVIGKMTFSEKALMKVASAFVPEVYDIEWHEKQFLIGLINKHEGKLSPQVFSGYRTLAQKMNQERIANEKELEALRAQSKSE